MENSRERKSDSYKNILKNGDLFEASNDLRKNIFLRRILIGSFALPMAISSSSDIRGSAFLAGAFGAAAGMASYVYSIRRDARKMEAAEKPQQEIRDSLGCEPVDIFKTYIDSQNEPVLLMRWYGADKNDSTGNIASRLEALLENEEVNNDVYSFAFGIDWAEKEGIDFSTGALGSVVDGEYFAQKVKRGMAPKVIDAESDKKVLIANRKQCQDILERLGRDDLDLSTISKLLESNGRSKVPEKLAEINSNDISEEEKRYLVHNNLASRVKFELLNCFEASKREQKRDGQFERYSRFINIQGSKLKSSWQDSKGRVELDQEDLCSIFGFLSDKDFLESFESKVKDENSIYSLEELLFAAHLMIEKGNESNKITPTKDSSTFFQIIKEDYSSGDLEHERFKRTLRGEKLAQACLAGCMVLTVTGSIVGGATDQLLDEGARIIEADFENRYGSKDQLPKSWEEYKNSNFTYRAHEFKDFLTVFEQENSKNDKPEINYKESNSLPEALSGLSIGDSEISKADANKTMFKVESLSGGKTEGYWYTHVFNKINIKNTEFGSTYPFNDVKLNFERSYDKVYGLLNPGLAPESNQASYRINTSRVDGFKLGNDVALPIKQNTKFVSAQLVSTDGKAPTITPDVIRYPDGTISAKVDLDEIKEDFTKQDLNNFFKDPSYQLVYWLADSSDKIRASAGMDYGVKNEKTLANSVRQGLGLKNDASSSDVYDSIRSKTYSLNPIQESGEEHFLSGLELSRQQKLKEIASKTAKLGYAICNIAALDFNFASAGNTGPLNYSGGFMNDGDNVLKGLEMHAWNVDGNGSEIDATPPDFRNVTQWQLKEKASKEKAEKPKDQMDATLKWFGGLVVAFSAAGALWGARRVAVRVGEKRLLSSLDDPAISYEHAELQKILYGRPDSTVVNFDRSRSKTTSGSKGAVTVEEPILGDDLRRSIENNLPEFNGQQEYELTKILPNKKTARRLFKLSRLLKAIKKNS